MEIYQLECFYEVAQGKSFLQVAEEMNMSQSSVSRMIRSLENEVGVPLFDRSRRSVVLSPAGQVLLSDLKDLLPQIHKTLDHVRSYADNKSLSYAVVPYTPFLQVQKIVDSFYEMNPRCKVIRREIAEVPEALEALKNYRIDYLIYHRMGEEDSDLFEYEEIHNDRLMIAIPVEHPFASYEQIPLSEIASERLLVNKQSYFDFMKVSAAYGIRFQAHFENLPRVELLMQVLEQGSLGVIWESETKLFRFSSLVMRPLQIASIPYVIATRKAGMNDLQISFLRYLVKEKVRLDHY